MDVKRMATFRSSILKLLKIKTFSSCLKDSLPYEFNCSEDIELMKLFGHSFSKKTSTKKSMKKKKELVKSQSKSLEISGCSKRVSHGSNEPALKKVKLPGAVTIPNSISLEKPTPKRGIKAIDEFAQKLSGSSVKGGVAATKRGKMRREEKASCVDSIFNIIEVKNTEDKDEEASIIFINHTIPWLYFYKTNELQAHPPYFGYYLQSGGCEYNFLGKTMNWRVALASAFVPCESISSKNQLPDKVEPGKCNFLETPLVRIAIIAQTVLQCGLKEVKEMLGDALKHLNSVVLEFIEDNSITEKGFKAEEHVQAEFMEFLTPEDRLALDQLILTHLQPLKAWVKETYNLLEPVDAVDEACSRHF
eukprot:TRINITY_DN720_c0_g1_i2.p1 TRINITY_DN720_c0_g1~~TRINITY_DN720_c0_g1_i2.p1  ORF type:complete len:362 (-),score=54.21 TRINITY_DN720_c0_g1_i2:159-1244(-)